MKSHALLLAAALALGACSAATGPAPQGPPVPAPVTTAPVRPGVPPAGELLTAMPDRWWLLDPETERVFGTGVDRAYRELLAGRQPRQDVVVAIIDSGTEWQHEDLRGSLWRNPGEVAGNGRDDDGNGYVDDVYGWNFIGGADGRHVDEDTYEVTRLHARCTGAAAAGAVTTRPSAAECVTIAAAFAEKRAETETMLAQVRQMDVVVAQIVTMLEQQVGPDSLTAERVAALTPQRPEVRQAQQMYLQLDRNGITPQVIRDEIARQEDLLEYGLNPSFDPRPIVGDDYANLEQRIYGNADVIGPDAAHGTGVAGIVGATRDNGIGVDGIGPRVQLMVLRTVPNGDERDKDVANAIRYAVDNGADIINMSFGKAWSPEKAAVDAAVRHADQQGVLLVHAAGNDAKDLATEKNFPTRFYEDGDSARLWLEVGASSWEGGNRLAAPFSNFGLREVHVFAPGVNVNSTAPDNDYHAASGTSFAAPVVSGIAALLMAYYPDLTAADIKRIILESATPLRERRVVVPGTDDVERAFGQLSATGGIVNAHAAVLMAERLAAQRGQE